MKTWKSNLEETKQRYINWWNHKGIILNMWEHFQEGVQPHAEITPPAPAKDLSQKWFDPQWRAEYLDWYVAHSSLKADILPVANTQLGPGSLAAILGGVFEGGEDTIWIHPNPDFTDEIVFNPEHPNWILHKELLKACKAKANGHYFVGMPDLMEGLDVLAALKGTDRVLLDTVMQPEILEQQMQQINDIYFKVFDELYDIIREGDEMAFCYFSSWAPGKMSKLQSDISTMISQDDYRRFVQPFIREQCQKIDYTLYHLDGVGAMHHLPALLEIEELNAIQWTPGVGEPQGGSPKWYDLYKKILAGGKSVMACWVTLDELKPLLDHIGADGVHLEMDFHNEKEVEQAMRIVEEYTGSSTAVNTNEHQQDADLAATGQERICIREEQHQEEDKLQPLYEAIVAGKQQRAVSSSIRDYGRDYWTGTVYTTNRRIWEHDEVFKEYLKKTRAMAVDMETATLFSCGFANHIPTGALLLVSDQPMTPDGVKTDKSDNLVTKNYVEEHVEIGIASLRMIIDAKKTVKHLKFDW